MRWVDWVEQKVHDNVMACQKITGKPLTGNEVSQVRSMVTSIMKQLRKQQFRNEAQRDKSCV